METQDNAAIIRGLYDAFNDNDLDRAAALVSEDFRLVDFAAVGQTFRGPEGLRQWLQIFLTAAPDAKVDFTNVVSAREGGWYSPNTQLGAPTRAR